jgi:hypothetical protein
MGKHLFVLKNTLSSIRRLVGNDQEKVEDALRHLGIKNPHEFSMLSTDQASNFTGVHQNVLSSVETFVESQNFGTVREALNKQSLQVGESESIDDLLRSQLTMHDSQLKVVLLEGTEYLEVPVSELAGVGDEQIELSGKAQKTVVFNPINLNAEGNNEEEKAINLIRRTYKNILRKSPQSLNKYFGKPIQRTTVEGRVEGVDVTSTGVQRRLGTVIEAPGSPPNKPSTHNKDDYQSWQLGGTCYANAVARSIASSSSDKVPLIIQVPDTPLFCMKLHTNDGARYIAFRYENVPDSFSTSRVGRAPKTRHITLSTLGSRFHGENFLGGDPNPCLKLFCGNTGRYQGNVQIKNALKKASANDIMVLGGTTPDVHIISIQKIEGGRFKLIDPNGKKKNISISVNDARKCLGNRRLPAVGKEVVTKFGTIKSSKLGEYTLDKSSEFVATLEELTSSRAIFTGSFDFTVNYLLKTK